MDSLIIHPWILTIHGLSKNPWMDAAKNNDYERFFVGWVPQKNNDYERFLIGWMPQKIMIMKDFFGRVGAAKK